jgi:hypothetical protein
MAQSAEEWSKVAFYESVADDENAVPELRVVFARKANWLRILARLQAKGLQTHQKNAGNPLMATDREALLFSPTRLAAAGTNNRASEGHDKRQPVTGKTMASPTAQFSPLARQQYMFHRVGLLFRSPIRSVPHKART